MTVATQTTAQEALELCLQTMKDGARGKVVPDTLLDWVRTQSLPNFNQHFEPVKWRALRAQVVESSRVIGEIALMLATLEKEEQITRAAVIDAIRAVKNHCVAGRPPSGDQPHVVYVFCPDLP